MNKTKVTAHTYVCELPETIQNQIFQECKATFQSLAFPVDIEVELDNVKGCKMCDLENTIDVQKYYTRKQEDARMNTRQAEKAMNEVLRDFNLQDIAKYELVKEALQKMLYTTDFIENDLVKAFISFCKTGVLDMTKVRHAL